MSLFSANRAEKIIHQANVFISKTDGVAIIVTLHYNGNGGFLYEDNEPVVITPPLEPSKLGQEIITALKRTSTNLLKITAPLKRTDWPAFKASNAESVRRFEQTFIRILIRGANASNLVYVIEGEPQKDSVLRVTSSLSSSAQPKQLGDRILLVYRACRDRQL
jgi:hypothetical protein